MKTESWSASSAPARPLDIARAPLHKLTGVALVVLGSTVMLGWLLEWASAVRVLPQFSPMVFATAFSFSLAGIALLWPVPSAGRAAIVTACGALLAALAAAVLVEHAFGVSLGVDLPELHRWLRDGASNPGRMSIPAASAFAASAASLILVAHASRPAHNTAVRAASLFVAMIGILAFAGYLVSARLLFPDYAFAGVALHTAAGFLVLAAGLYSAANGLPARRQPFFAREDDRITFIGGAVLAAVTLCAGIATFSVLQGRVQSLVGDDLLAALSRRIDVFQDMIDLREGNARIAATRPAAARNLRVIRAGRDDGSNLANIRAVVDSFLKQGFSAISYSDVDGKTVATGGQFSAAPKMAVALATAGGADLLWDGGFLLRNRLPVHDSEGRVGEVIAEQRLPVLTRLTTTPPGRGETWDMGVCVRRDEKLFCFPQRLTTMTFSTPLTNVGGDPLPMTRALRGESGIAITRDYRQQHVVAAYGPIGNLGLGMVVKVDAAEVFSPIREQLQLALGLLFCLVAAGTVLLRSQVRPLATRLVDAERELRDMNVVLDMRVQERTVQLHAALDDLRRSEEHYRMLFDANPHPMWVYDVQTLQYLAVNEAAVEHYGYTKEQFLRMTPLDIRPPEDMQRVRALIGALEADKPHHGIYRHLKKSGERIFVEVTSGGLRFNGRPARLVLAHDITKRKEAEEEIYKLNEQLEDRVAQRTTQLEAANKELEAFSYSVSHDLRAPLRHISGFAEMLTDEAAPALTESASRYLAVIRDSVKQMGKLIDDLLLFSKMGRVDMRHEQVDMNSLVREAAAEVEGATQQRIEWEIAALPEVRGDGATLKQVWLNLLSNAAKYSRKRDIAKISVGWARDGAEIQFCVRDNGTGFDMKYAGKLFGVFQRLHQQDEFEGTGIGLANVRRIVTRHGGRTWAEGRSEEGASFYFTLPRQDARS